jgi:hypothetical protein
MVTVLQKEADQQTMSLYDLLSKVMKHPLPLFVHKICPDPRREEIDINSLELCHIAKDHIEGDISLLWKCNLSQPFLGYRNSQLSHMQNLSHFLPSWGLRQESITLSKPGPY